MYIYYHFSNLQHGFRELRVIVESSSSRKPRAYLDTFPFQSPKSDGHARSLGNPCRDPCIFLWVMR